MTAINSSFANNMHTLISAQNHVLIEVTKSGDIHEVSFLGKIWRKIQVIFGFGQGFEDCKLRNISERIAQLLQNHLDAFYSLPQNTQSAVRRTLSHFKEHARDKQASQIFGILTASLRIGNQLAKEDLTSRLQVLSVLKLADSLDSLRDNDDIPTITLVNGLMTAIAMNDGAKSKNLAQIAQVRVSQEPSSLSEMGFERAYYQLLLIVALRTQDEPFKKDLLNFLEDKKPLFGEESDICNITGPGLGAIYDLIDGISMGEILGNCVNQNYALLQEKGLVRLSENQFELAELTVRAYAMGAEKIGGEVYNHLLSQRRWNVAASLFKIAEPSPALNAFYEKFKADSSIVHEKTIGRVQIDFQSLLASFSTTEKQSLCKKDLAACLERIKKVLGTAT